MQLPYGCWLMFFVFIQPQVHIHERALAQIDPFCSVALNTNIYNCVYFIRYDWHQRWLAKAIFYCSFQNWIKLIRKLRPPCRFYSNINFPRQYSKLEPHAIGNRNHTVFWPFCDMQKQYSNIDGKFSVKHLFIILRKSHSAFENLNGNFIPVRR